MVHQMVQDGIYLIHKTCLIPIDRFQAEDMHSVPERASKILYSEANASES